MATGMKELLGRWTDTDDKPPEPDEEGIPPQSFRKAWAQANKPEMGVFLFSVKGNYRAPAYINLVDMDGGGGRLTVYFSHMTVKIEGKGLEALAEGLRRQVIRYIQERHTSEFEAGQETHYVESIKISVPAEPEELGQWAG